MKLPFACWHSFCNNPPPILERVKLGDGVVSRPLHAAFVIERSPDRLMMPTAGLRHHVQRRTIGLKVLSGLNRFAVLEVKETFGRERVRVGRPAHNK